MVLLIPSLIYVIGWRHGIAYSFLNLHYRLKTWLLFTFDELMKMKKGNFRQATLGTFGFRKTVIHVGAAVNVEIPNLVEDVPAKRLKCSECEKYFVNNQGLSVHLKCAHTGRDLLKSHKSIATVTVPKKTEVSVSECIKLDVESVMDSMLKKVYISYARYSGGNCRCSTVDIILKRLSRKLSIVLSG